MAQFGVHNEGTLDHKLKKLESGVVIPDASLSEIHQCNQQLIKNQIEIGVYADKLGYDYLIHPENHLNLIGNNSPTPIQIQVAIATQTDSIKLMQMTNILPWHDPVNLAERLGMLDIVSNGRVEVGVGTGTGDRENGVFTQYWNESRISKEEFEERFLERCEILIRAWTQDFFSFRGNHHNIPPEDIEWKNLEFDYLADDVSNVKLNDALSINSDTTTLNSISVFPQPEQHPHPQLWRPISSKNHAIWAAQHGINGCTFCINFEWVREAINIYYDAAEEAEWPDHRHEYDGQPYDYGWDEYRGRGLVSEMMIFNKEIASEEAFERFKRGIEFTEYINKPNAENRESKDKTIDAETYIEENDAPVIGSSEEIIDELVRFKEICGYENLIVFPTIGVPGMKHEDKIKQMESFSEKVIPYFNDD